MTQILPSRAPVVGAVSGNMYNGVGSVLHIRREFCILGALKRKSGVFPGGGDICVDLLLQAVPEMRKQTISPALQE